MGPQEGRWKTKKRRSETTAGNGPNLEKIAKKGHNVKGIGKTKDEKNVAESKSRRKGTNTSVAAICIKGCWWGGATSSRRKEVSRKMRRKIRGPSFVQHRLGVEFRSS